MLNDLVKPILFSTPMVQAILEGRKSQTRRIIKPQPWGGAGYDDVISFQTQKDQQDGLWYFMMEYSDGSGTGPWKCPYGIPGDTLCPAMYIPGYPKTYCADYNGAIYSKARGNWRPLKTWLNNKGYASVSIMDNGKKTSYTVHRLICRAFNGNPENESMQVRHLDGNPENNIASNLQWGTQQENWQDRKAHGNGCEGEKHHNYIFTDQERSHIKWAIEKGLCSQKHAARILEVGHSSIYGICHPEERIIPTQSVPKEACRLFLEITDVKVERLMDISEEDATQEGFQEYDTYSYIPGEAVQQIESTVTATTQFLNIWDRLHGKGATYLNPFVWVVSFKRKEAIHE